MHPSSHSSRLHSSSTCDSYASLRPQTCVLVNLATLDCVPISFGGLDLERSLEPQAEEKAGAGAEAQPEAESMDTA